jgi:hypothetical protein
MGRYNFGAIIRKLQYDLFNKIYTKSSTTSYIDTAPKWKARVRMKIVIMTDLRKSKKFGI